jgi:hypothetical protein
MKLSGNNLIAKKDNYIDYEGVYGNVRISSGLHFWTVTIDRIQDMNDVMIGVSSKMSNPGSQHHAYDKFYGWHATNGRKLRPHSTTGKTEQKDYGQPAKQGDVIGVLL